VCVIFIPEKCANIFRCDKSSEEMRPEVKVSLSGVEVGSLIVHYHYLICSK